MGYIKNIDLMAFLTQKGKKYILGSDNKKNLITHFSLADPDVDYYVASSQTKNTIGKKNIIPINFIPNISGVFGANDLCLKYLSDGIIQRYSLLGGDVHEFVGPDLTPITIVPEDLLTLDIVIARQINNNGQYGSALENILFDDVFSKVNLSLDYVYSQLKSQSNDFDIKIDYLLLNPNFSVALKPNGQETFKVVFNVYNQTLLKNNKLLYNNTLIENPIKFDTENLFILTKTEINNNLIYVKSVNVDDILNLPDFGWNIIADIDFISIKFLKIPPNIINKKIRFYKPTTVKLQSSSAIGNTVNLGNQTYTSDLQKMLFTIPHTYLLNGKSPAGLEEVTSLLSTSNSEIKNLRFKSNQSNQEVIKFNTNDTLNTSPNFEVEFEVNTTKLIYGKNYMQFNIQIKTVNDFVLCDAVDKILVFTFIISPYDNRT